MLCYYAKLMESIKSSNTQDFTHFEFLEKSNMIDLSLKKINCIYFMNMQVIHNCVLILIYTNNFMKVV